MSHIEIKGDNLELFKEHMTTTLSRIYDELHLIGTFMQETLTHEHIDRITAVLGPLAERAKGLGDRAKSEVLSKLEMSFYFLSTVGIHDNDEKFREKSTHAFDLLEIALLSMGGSAAEQIMDNIEIQRGAYDS
jgi:hypothetical protein